MYERLDTRIYIYSEKKKNDMRGSLQNWFWQEPAL